MSAMDDLYAALDLVRAAEARREEEQANPPLMYCHPDDVERVRAAEVVARRQAPVRGLWPRRPVEVHASSFATAGQAIVIDPLAMRGPVIA